MLHYANVRTGATASVSGEDKDLIRWLGKLGYEQVIDVETPVETFFTEIIEEAVEEAIAEVIAEEVKAPAKKKAAKKKASKA